MLLTKVEREVESLVEEQLYYAKFDVPEGEGRKIEDEDAFLVGVNAFIAWRMQTMMAMMKIMEMRMTWDMEEFMMWWLMAPNY